MFLAQFEVDENARPYWNGNLKKLKLLETTDSFGTTTLSLVDVSNMQAIAPDGRIAFDALTYWTDGNTLPTPTGTEIAGKDGRAVKRGGSAQNIPGFLGGTLSIGDDNGPTTRTVYTEPSSGTTLLNLGVSNAATLQSDLGAGSTADAETLIRWIRGQDVNDEDIDSDCLQKNKGYDRRTSCKNIKGKCSATT